MLVVTEVVRRGRPAVATAFRTPTPDDTALPWRGSKRRQRGPWARACDDGDGATHERSARTPPPREPRGSRGARRSGRGQAPNALAADLSLAAIASFPWLTTSLTLRRVALRLSAAWSHCTLSWR